MRFMGFSKSYLPVRFAALALVCAFVASLGIVGFPSEAEAGRRNVWSVKYKCSIDGLDDYDPVLDDDIPFINGTNEFVVQTTVNIHNPNDRSVEFKKKVVIIAPKHVNKASAKSSQSSAITLSANLGEAIDCEDIVDLLTVDQGDPTIDPTDFAVEGVFEGFVVIESKRGGRIPELVVCANYFAAVWDDSNNEGGGVSA